MDVNALRRDIVEDEIGVLRFMANLIWDEINGDDAEDEGVRVPRPMHTSRYTGHVWVLNILNGHERRCYNLFRLNPPTFIRLRDTLVERALIKDSRWVTASEQLAMFLYAMGHGVATGAMCEHFQHSSQTISFHVNQVINAIVELRHAYIQLSVPTTDVHPFIKNNNKFPPYFKVTYTYADLMF